MRVDASREIGIGLHAQPRAGGWVAGTPAQFDLLRVVDTERYPAFFDCRGRRYIVKIEKAVSDEEN